jgi:hypothetical protein
MCNYQAIKVWAHSECLEVIEGHLVACKMEEGILKHAAMAVAIVVLAGAIPDFPEDLRVD